MKQEEKVEFLKSIYSLYGGTELPVEIKDDVEGEVGLLIFQGVIATSAMMLSPEKNDALEHLLDTNASMESIIQFLETEIIEFPELIKTIGSKVMSILIEEK